MFNEEENYKINNNYIIYFFLYLIIINNIFYIVIKIYYDNKNFSPYSSKITKIKVMDGKSAKIGIISDFHLNKNNSYHIYQEFSNNLYQALKVFKKKKVNIILIAGDITDNGDIINYIYFKQIFYSVYNEIERPIVISIMGDNDYLDMSYSKIENQKKFFSYMNSYPYSHYLINNYNFIFCSNDNQQITKNGIENYSWLNSSIEEAKKNEFKKGDPIFVVTHLPPKNTVYGSENLFGNERIFEFLKNYPDVICISGHSHYSLRNLKSIWQGEFTVINTQSLSNIDLNNTFQNSLYIRYNSAKNNSMGLILNLNEENAIFERINFSNEEVMEERWKINFPIKTSDFKYRFDRRNKKIKPVFNDKNEIKIEKIDDNNNIKENFIVFNAAMHEEYVYIDKIFLKEKKNNKNIKEYFYYSDYFKNKKFRKNIIKFKLPNNINKGKYDVEIFAIDTFDNISEPKKGVIDI